MKIFVVSYDLNTLGGSGRSLQTICQFLESSDYGDQIWYTDERQDIEKIQRWNPDIILSQQWATSYASKVARELNKPFVMFCRGPGQYEYFFNPGMDGYDKDNRVDLVVFNTETLKNQCKGLGDTRTYILNPPVRPLPCPTEICLSTRKFITLIGTEQVKGWDVLVSLANTMPYLNFLWITDNTHRLKLPSNVTVKQKQKDIVQIYEQTAILIMPSINESYGRTSVEAAFLSVPTVATDLPGIREATCNLATYIKDRKDMSMWKNSIVGILSNYEKNIVRCALIVEQKDYEKDLMKFRETLFEQPGI